MALNREEIARYTQQILAESGGCAGYSEDHESTEASRHGNGGFNGGEWTGEARVGSALPDSVAFLPVNATELSQD